MSVFRFFGQHRVVPMKWTRMILPAAAALAVAVSATEAHAQKCLTGYVWREATTSDLVCVSPGAHRRVKRENSLAASRRQPGGGAYGPNTCKSGYVWREAYKGDVVCVTPGSRSLAAQENKLGPGRIAGGPADTVQPGGIYFCNWYGSAPFCEGRCPPSTKLKRRSASGGVGFPEGFGAPCKSGFKVYCCL